MIVVAHVQVWHSSGADGRDRMRQDTAHPVHVRPPGASWIRHEESDQNEGM